MTKRPDGTSMEGMIWNAHHVLEAALDPKTDGIPKNLFVDAHGIVLISIVEAGFIFSGNVGTGIIMAKEKEGKWSAPAAVGLVGLGYGFLIGASMKDLIIFLMDDDTMAKYAENVHLMLGCEVNLSVGTFSRSAEVDLTASNNVGGAIAIAHSRGAFVAAAFEAGALNPKKAVNAQFYGKEVTPHQILFDRAVDIPEGSLVPEIHVMLKKLAKGEASVLSEEQQQKKELAKQEAEEAAELAKSIHDDIEYLFHDMREKLAKGEASVLSEEQQQKKEVTKQEAEEAAELAKSIHDVEYVFHDIPEKLAEGEASVLSEEQQQKKELAKQEAEEAVELAKSIHDDIEYVFVDA